MALIAFRRGKWVFDRIGNNGRRRVTTCKDEADAQVRLERYLAKKELGLPPDEEPKSKKRKVLKANYNGETPIEDAIQKFSETVLVPSRKPQILKIEKSFLSKLYDSLFEQHCYYAEDIETAHVDKLLSELQRDYAAASVNRIFGVHKLFFKTMVRWNVLKADPSSGMKQMVVESKPKQVWSEKDFEAFIAEIPDWAKPVLTFIRLTGCRPGQATNLRWKDVNFAENTWHTKSEKGRKIKILNLPLLSEARQLLEDALSSRAEGIRSVPKESHVFTGFEGREGIPTDALYKLIKRTEERWAKRREQGLEAPELSGFATYGLRTSYGTDLVRDGVPLKFVAELMGHSDTRTTERWYVKDVSAEARKALENRSSRKGKGS